MMRQYHKDLKIDRSKWLKGPWDQEPDYFEWITNAGYPAFMGRLDCGRWFGVVEAPYPTEGIKLMQFIKYVNNFFDRKIELTSGIIAKTEIEGIGEWSISSEHDNGPGNFEPNRRYRTFEDIVKNCEKLAEKIVETWQSDYLDKRFYRR